MNGYEYAIKMELDGEMFYREQALVNKDNVLNPVFLSLAEDEKQHAIRIKEKEAGNDFLPDEEDMAKTKNVFTDAAGLDPEKSTTEQIDAYRKALEMEAKSIDLYKKLLSESNENKDLFEFLIKQEEKHYNLIEEIIEMVIRPNEWVESAEFGLRKKY
ncbi:ferritin family protein [Fusibacter bizertensis]|uniref:Ferritin family protein n=1 Tax=Fusibacter bizertensis TaxID=1488331 RepID=A0ABT6NE44_9FIRM|nr:ferritin family protein [Fusibacter bizertensis]MDH8678680.1 ferritin family protein [Fusibacter bizertensis]